LTLIIALTFKDGVIMAADSLGTESVVGHPLLDYSMTVEKVSAVGKHVVWGGSGSAGLSQEVKDALDAWGRANEGLLDKPAEKVCPQISKAVQDVVNRVFAGSPFKDNPQAAPDSLKNTFLLSGKPKDASPWLLEVQWYGEKTRYDESGFHAIGSARVYAYAAHGMLLHYGVKHQDLQNALLCAYRILNFAVRAAASGVREPYTFWVIDSKGGRQISSTEVNGLRDTVGVWLENERASLTTTS
jgi:20S proteasome alpha/beta subunit